MVSLVQPLPGALTVSQGELLDQRLTHLSVAERDVLELVRQGLSNKEIAGARERSVATVKNQIQSIFQKLGVGSRCRLIAWTR